MFMIVFHCLKEKINYQLKPGSTISYSEVKNTNIKPIFSIALKDRKGIAGRRTGSHTHAQ